MEMEGVSSVQIDEMLGVAAKLLENRHYRQAIGQYQQIAVLIQQQISESVYGSIEILNRQLFDVYGIIATLNEMIGEYLEAFNVQATAATVMPDSPIGLVHLALLSLIAIPTSRDNTSHAMSLISYAITRCSGPTAESYCFAARAAVCHAVRNWNGAIMDARRAVNRGPQLVAALIVLADTYKVTSRVESGTLYMKAAELDQRSRQFIGRGFALDRVNEMLAFFRRLWPAWTPSPQPGYTYRPLKNKKQYNVAPDPRAMEAPPLRLKPFLSRVSATVSSPSRAPPTPRTPQTGPTRRVYPKPGAALSSAVIESIRPRTTDARSPRAVSLPFVPNASGRADTPPSTTIPSPHGVVRAGYDKPWRTPGRLAPRRTSPHRMRDRPIEVSPRRRYRQPWSESVTPRLGQSEANLPAVSSMTVHRPSTAVTPVSYSVNLPAQPATAAASSARAAVDLVDTLVRGSSVLGVRVPGAVVGVDGEETREQRALRRRDVEILKQATSEYLATLTPTRRPAPPPKDVTRSPLGQSPQIPRPDDRDARTAMVAMGIRPSTGAAPVEEDSEDDTPPPPRPASPPQAKGPGDVVVNNLAATLLARAPELIHAAKPSPLQEKRPSPAPTTPESCACLTPDQVRAIDVPRPSTGPTRPAPRPGLTPRQVSPLRSAVRGSPRSPVRPAGSPARVGSGRSPNVVSPHESASFMRQRMRRLQLR